MNLGNLLYQLGRLFSKAGSISNDVKNIAEGKPEKVLTKAINREMHKGLNSILRGK